MTSKRELAVALQQYWLARIDMPIMLGTNDQGPDTCIVITPYDIGGADMRFVTGEEVIGIQFKYRGAAREGNGVLWDRQELIQDTMCKWRMKANVLQAGAKIVAVELNSSVEIGTDDKRRPEVTDNFYFKCDRLGTQ